MNVLLQVTLHVCISSPALVQTCYRYSEHFQGMITGWSGPLQAMFQWSDNDDNQLNDKNPGADSTGSDQEKSLMLAEYPQDAEDDQEKSLMLAEYPQDAEDDQEKSPILAEYPQDAEDDQEGGPLLARYLQPPEERVSQPDQQRDCEELEGEIMVLHIELLVIVATAPDSIVSIELINSAIENAQRKYFTQEKNPCIKLYAEYEAVDYSQISESITRQNIQDLIDQELGTSREHDVELFVTSRSISDDFIKKSVCGHLLLLSTLEAEEDADHSDWQDHTDLSLDRQDRAAAELGLNIANLLTQHMTGPNPFHLKGPCQKKWNITDNGGPTDCGFYAMRHRPTEYDCLRKKP